MAKEPENKEQQQNNEEIIVDLKKKDDDNTVANLSKEEQDKIKVISDKLREELGIEEEKQKAKEEKQQAKQEEQEEPQEKTEEEIYRGFIKKYSKKEDAVDTSSAGKYDSDLDFKINRKIKRIHLPLPKKSKIILSVAAGVFAVGMVAAVAVALYKPPVPVTLASVAITQPTMTMSGKTYYIVRDVSVGDTVNYDNIYLNCKYSDGSTKRVPISSSMATLATNGAVVNGKFVQTGNVDYNIIYEGKQLTLRFNVSENLPESLSAFASNFNSSGESSIEVAKADGIVDLTNRLVVKVTYANGTTKRVNLADCKFAIDDIGTPRTLAGNILELPSNTGEHFVKVYYTETLANGSTNTVTCTFILNVR